MKARAVAAVVHPGKKYYGVSLAGVPQSMQPYNKVARQAHKAPNVIGYFQDWTHAFSLESATRVCRAHATPMLAWESWSWEDVDNGVTRFSQPKYAPRRIARGDFDPYIRATAHLIAKAPCRVMLRFDQETNGRWYPWGLTTPGMHNKAHQIVGMWRHVWRIFHHVGVKNVIWTWSPNLLYRGGVDKLGALYPGKRFVDMIGIDGYLKHPGDTPKSVLGPIMKRLKTVAPSRPWFVAETGVAGGPHQARRIASLLHFIASTHRLKGFVYLSQVATSVDWRFNSTRKALRAFRRAVANPVFGAAGG